MRRREAGNYVDKHCTITDSNIIDSNIRNSVCTPAKLPCRRVEVGYDALSYDNLLYNDEKGLEFGKYMLSSFGGQTCTI
jgi:hypothetical protein